MTLLPIRVSHNSPFISGMPKNTKTPQQTKYSNQVGEVVIVTPSKKPVMQSGSPGLHPPSVQPESPRKSLPHSKYNRTSNLNVAPRSEHELGSATPTQVNSALPERSKYSIAASSKVKWTLKEIDSVKKGISRYGIGNWKSMLDDKQLEFNPKRDATDLKDKVRNLQKANYSSNIQNNIFKVGFRLLAIIDVASIWFPAVAPDNKLDTDDVLDFEFDGDARSDKPMNRTVVFTVLTNIVSSPIGWVPEQRQCRYWELLLRRYIDSPLDPSEVVCKKIFNSLELLEDKKRLCEALLESYENERSSGVFGGPLYRDVFITPHFRRPQGDKKPTLRTTFEKLPDLESLKSERGRKNNNVGGIATATAEPSPNVTPVKRKRGRPTKETRNDNKLVDSDKTPKVRVEVNVAPTQPLFAEPLPSRPLSEVSKTPQLPAKRKIARSAEQEKRPIVGSDAPKSIKPHTTTDFVDLGAFLLNSEGKDIFEQKPKRIDRTEKVEPESSNSSSEEAKSPNNKKSHKKERIKKAHSPRREIVLSPNSRFKEKEVHSEKLYDKAFTPMATRTKRAVEKHRTEKSGKPEDKSTIDDKSTNSQPVKVSKLEKKSVSNDKSDKSEKRTLHEDQQKKILEYVRLNRSMARGDTRSSTTAVNMSQRSPDANGGNPNCVLM